MHYPLIATGRVQWLAAKVNVPFESVTKPAPIQALAAIGAALHARRSELAVGGARARGARRIDRAVGMHPERSASTHVWIVEDGILGLQATHGAIDLLKHSGLDIHAHAIGIAAGGPKAEALAPLSEIVLPDVNAAIEYIEPCLS